MTYDRSIWSKEDLRIAVIGGGESGVGAALLAASRGYEVYVSESKEIKPALKEELIRYNIRFEEYGHKEEWLLNVHVAIKSPGVPDHAPPILLLREHGIPFLSEIEFGYLHYSGCLLAVTGSNGKTTTSGLLGHVIQTHITDTITCGNIGTSFCRILAGREPACIVLEVSSFQLDDVVDFRPYIAVLLNISADHLDRYDYQIALYAKAKMKITERQQATDHFIYNDSDEWTLRLLEVTDSRATSHPVSVDDYWEVLPKSDGKPYNLSLHGRHNRFNAACVVKAAKLMGMSEEAIDEALSTYRNFPHRLEYVGKINGVDFINDSKATNVDAVYYALEAMDKPVIWIAGGIDKGNDYNQIADFVKTKVKTLIALGLDNKKLVESYKHIKGDKESNYIEVNRMEDAISMAISHANPGDVVLLSPACSSFDLFKNYEDRGDQFRTYVLQCLK